MRLRSGKDENDATRLLKWIGKAVNLACNVEAYPFKDNEASRVKANEANAEAKFLRCLVLVLFGVVLMLFRLWHEICMCCLCFGLVFMYFTII